MDILLLVLAGAGLLLFLLYRWRRQPPDGPHPPRVSASPYRAADVDAFAWPPFFESEHVRVLVARVGAAADDDAERRRFFAVLRRAYEETRELEILFRELPGVLKNEPDALAHFRQVLLRSSRRGVRRGAGPRADAPASAGGGAREQSPALLGLDRVLLVAQGARHVAAGDAAAYARYADTLRGLWRRSRPLENLFRLALQEPGPDGRGRLGDHLRFLVRDRVGDPGGRAGAGWTPVHGPPGDGFHGGSGSGRELSPDDLWPPDDLDVTWPDEDWPVPGRGEIPRDYHDLDYVLEPCLDAALDGIGGAELPPPRTFAGGITSISPTAACAGEEVSVQGTGFGAAQPAGMNVLIGEVPADVVAWSDTLVRIRVPEAAVSGCVGFRHPPGLERSGRRGYATTLEGVALQASRCSGRPVALVQPSDGSDPAPCTGANFLRAGLPRVRLLANGRGAVSVQPGAHVLLSWQVENADSFQVRRADGAGPALQLTDPAGNTADLGPIEGNRSFVAGYVLTAFNPCGTALSTVQVELRQPPALRILGIEVVQAIQRFSLADASGNNSVRLAERKRTLARVYVDSGITNGFDNGAGPGVQAGVTGSITVFPSGADAGVPIGLTLDAPPAAALDRTQLAATLNFELPLDALSGEVRLEARAWVLNREGEAGSGWVAEPASTTVTFQPRGGISLVPMRIADGVLNLPAPTDAAFGTTLQGARTRFPIAEDGFTVAAPSRTMTTSHDLRLDTDWARLLIDLNFFAADTGETLAAVVPGNPAYALNGIAAIDADLVIPAFISQSGLTATLAHELAHTFWIAHANCSPSGVPPFPTDFSLPPGTEDVGMDVAAGQLVPAGTGELMSYCGGQSRWPSIALWNQLWDAF